MKGYSKESLHDSILSELMTNGDWCSIEQKNVVASDVIKTQLDILGFVLYTDEAADPRDALIVESNADKTQYSPTLKLYSIKTGKQEDFRIYRQKKGGKYSRMQTVFDEYPVAVGDIIHISDFERKQKSQRQNDGKYLPIEGEYEKWITEYYRTTRQ